MAIENCQLYGHNADNNPLKRKENRHEQCCQLEAANS
jgi:hypothetical protein